jgi:hypothetical protein
MSALRQAVEDYITLRRPLGSKLERHPRLLESFADYLEAASATTITIELALSWARLPGDDASPTYLSNRLCAVRGFARHLQAFDPATEVPPARLLPWPKCRATPYIYSEDDIAALMRAARLLTPVLRAATYESLIGLLSVTGMRGTVTCPAGHTVALSRTRIATFGVRCRDCPLRSRCTTCATGRKLVLHERDDLLRAARADWAADAGLRKDYMAHRPNVERAIAQVADWRGRRLKLRYRGVAKNHAWLKRRTAALNLRTLIGRGLARRGGGWVLVT